MFCVVGDLHDLLRGGSIVRLLGLPERLLVGIQHRVVELLASLLRAGEADVVIVPMAVLVLRHGDKGAFSRRSGEGYIDTAVKILIAVVLGALLLAGLYALFGDVVMPTLNQRIKDMFNYAGALGG